MQILQTPVRFHPYIGGVESYVHSLAKKHVASGHSVTVVCAKAKTETGKREIIDGITVRRLSSIGKIANTNITPALPKVLLEEARSADIIHTHIPTPWSADLSALAGAITDTPVIVTYHNDIIGDGLADYIATAYNRTMLQLTLGIADRIIVTQPDYIEDSSHLKPHTDKVRVVHNGVDVERFHPVELDTARRERLGFDSDRSNLFFLSVLDGHHGYKGLDVLLKSLAQLSESEELVPKLLVGGGGDAHAQYEQQATDLGVDDHVEFLGRVPDEDLVALYSGADLFVLPSKSSDQEGFGLVVLEAMACETPVVTTDVVGVSDDIIANDAGSIVAVDDSGALAEAISGGLTDGSFSAEQARTVCRNNYSWAASASKLEAIYEEVTGPSARDPL
ncbi:glycosyltransferase family 4 protein [Haloarcula argentinensis]|uniref:Glycosyltransferase family 4 protein n=1 Tax=Haloarcula argentinensis TaxID=43776 RepID=A0ABU2EYZ2_HALAR|nr:glycosyltransferase family 4 protein [Haloarcula argentinensis]EMA24370.1 glycosyltransferase [Haloarcula argentinensis DSM 12282]MDS0253514.1 glycosyltransferase family 4 protein [Haloarcula argentinensis]